MADRARCVGCGRFVEPWVIACRWCSLDVTLARGDHVPDHVRRVRRALPPRQREIARAAPDLLDLGRIPGVTK